MSIALDKKTPSFHYLHKKCLTRPKQVLYCAEDDEYFNSGETVHGYEYSKDQYVVLEDEDFERVPVRTTHSIDILSFVNLEEIDIVYYDDTHYLEPEELGIKPFQLLKITLEKTGLVGIAKVVFQKREHLCCVRPLNKILGLHTLHYYDDILPAGELAPPEKELSTDELDMALKLVDAMTVSFKPVKYRDEYTLALREMVQAKLKGVEIKAPEIPKVEIVDLMSALKASVAAASSR
jgi:DNA end-binding protein Ku